MNKKKSVRKSKDLAGIDWNVPDSVRVIKSGAAEEPNCTSTLNTKFFGTDIFQLIQEKTISILRATITVYEVVYEMFHILNCGYEIN